MVTEVANTVHYPNGLTLSKTAGICWWRKCWRHGFCPFPLKRRQLGTGTVWARMQDLATPAPTEDAYNGPDGLKLGPDGNYYIAQNGSGRVLVVGEDKKLVRTLDVPTPFVTNMAFGTAGTALRYRRLR